MKNVPVKNTAKARLVIRTFKGEDGLPLMFGPGEVKELSEAALEHPAVKRYVGEKGPLKVLKAGAKTKAPTPAPPPLVPPKETEEPTKPEDDDDDDGAEDDDETKAYYLDAPGITENNVDAVLEAYPTLEDLVDADEDGLVDCGVSKSFVSRVLEWAAS